MKIRIGVALFALGAIAGWLMTALWLQDQWRLESLGYEVLVNFATILAWPITVALALLLFRSEIAKKIGETRRIETPLMTGVFEVPVTDSTIERLEELTRAGEESKA